MPTPKYRYRLIIERIENRTGACDRVLSTTAYPDEQSLADALVGCKEHIERMADAGGEPIAKK